MRTFWLTGAALVSFAGNSILCRLALREGSMDPATFTTTRLLAGALTLSLLMRGTPRAATRNWISGIALFAYAGFFSFAYVGVPTATGALLLFAAVQATMILGGVARGERFEARQWIGLLVAALGAWVLLSPGVEAAPPLAALWMTSAGVAWGLYSLRARGASNSLKATAESFVVAAPLSLALSAVTLRDARIATGGVLLAIASGALASGLGYVLWHGALARLTAAQAAVSQLAVPALTAIGGIVVLSETPSLRLLVSLLLVLGGIGWTFRRGRASLASVEDGPAVRDPALDERGPGVVEVVFEGLRGTDQRTRRPGPG